MFRLRLQAGLALLSIAGLLASALVSFGAAQADLQRMATVSEPRAIAAADLYQALADLDAQHADELVVGYSGAPVAPGQAPTLVDDGVFDELTAQADQRRVSADLAVLAAASTAGDPTVQTLLDNLSLYDGRSGTEESSSTDQADPIAGRPPELALDYYDMAEGQLQQSVLPQVRDLLAGAEQQVAVDRNAVRFDARLGALLLGLLGIAALALLAWWQADLVRRFGRVVNPALLPATALVLAVSAAGVPALLGASAETGSAVSAGYTPYTVTAKALVETADAEASESRWLVDDAFRPSLQQQYTALMQTVSRQLAGGDATAPGLERTRTAYLAADARLRSLAGAGQPDQASVALTGETRGDVAFAYYDFSTHIDQLAQRQLAVTDGHLKSAADDLSGWTVLLPVLLGLALLLVLQGVRPRLAEFG